MKSLCQSLAMLCLAVSTAFVSTPTRAEGAPRDGLTTRHRSAIERPIGLDKSISLTQQLLAADGAPADAFAWSVAISGDRAIVGARWDDDAGDRSGAAYIFERDSGGPDNWGQVKKLLGADSTTGNFFGGAVAIDGDTVTVTSAYNGGVGAAYVFDRDAGGTANWGQVAKLIASDAAFGDEFGASVSISGDTVVVGSVYDDDAGSQSGSAYVFERDFGGTDNWGQVKKLLASDAAMDDLFHTVAISGDILVVGAPGNDDNAVESGSAYIFERDFGGVDNWGQVKKLNATDATTADRLGSRVAIDGDTALISAGTDDDAGAGAGSAYVFERHAGGTDNWGEVKKLLGADTAAGDQFGVYSIGISGDRVVVGAVYDDTFGSAYVFERHEGGTDNWGEAQKLTLPGAVAGDFFGFAAISGDTILIGAPNRDDAGADAGSAYIYEAPSSVDLAVSVAESSDPVTAGSAPGNLTYTVTLSNGGPAAATGVELLLDLSLPSGVGLDSVTPSAGSFATTTAPDGTWTVGGLGSGASATLTIELTTGADAAAGIDVVSCTASVSAVVETDADPLNDSATASTSIIRVTNLGITKSDSADPVDASSAFMYTLVATNNGPSTATSVQVVDTLPAGLVFDGKNAASTDWTCVEAPAGTVTCSLTPSIAPMATAQNLILDVTAPDEGGVVSNNATVTSAADMVGTSAMEDTIVTAVADLSMTKTDSADPVDAATGFSYTLQVANAGPSTATSVQVVDVLPAGVTFVGKNAASTDWSCVEAPAGTVTCDLTPSLAASASTQDLLLDVTAPDEGGVVTNNATVTAAEDAVGASAMEDTTVTAVADLAVTKVDSADPVDAAAAFQYTIGVTNNGPSTATSVQVVDVLPAGMAFVGKNAASTDWSCVEAPAGTVTCDLTPSLAASASAQDLLLDVTAPDEGGAVTNNATATATEDAVGDSAMEDTTITAVADLAITKVDSADPVNAASAFQYTIGVTNNGPSTATSVQVVDVLPAGVLFVGKDAASTDWSCVEAPAGTVTCDLTPSLAASASAQDLLLDVTAPDEGGVVTNNATATAAEDAVGASAMEDTTVSAVTLLAITKIDSADPVDPSTAFQYTIGVTNNGPSTATSVQVVDVLPPGVTFVGKSAASTDWMCVEAPVGTVTCDLAGSLASGVSAQSLVFDVTAPPLGGLVTNNATVTSTENPGGSSTMEDTTVTAVADLSVTKDDGVSEVPVGGSLTYTLTVENLGPNHDPNVSFNDTFPAELINCSWTSAASGGATGNSDSSGVAIMDTLDMPASSTVTYTVDCDVDPLTMSPEVTNTATATASASDPDAGNDSDSDTDTIVFDTDPPAVVLINSSPATGDGEITDCEQVAVTLNDLLVVFDEAMATMPDAGAADDASNFLLVEAGTDGDYQTTVCGVPGGDDQAVVPATVIYDADTPAPPESTSTLDFGSLADGLYRLIACSTLTDEAGNALEGGAFLRDFRIEAGNLFTNGHFDCNDDGWQTSPAAVGWDGTVDQDGSIASGSEQVDSGGVALATITQCVDLTGSINPFEITAATMLSAGGGVRVGVSRFCDFFDAAVCSGSLLGSGSGRGAILVDTGGDFVDGTAELNAPVGSVSALCGVEVLSPAAETFQLWLDGAHLAGGGLIFADGFESGDTSTWSVTVP